MPRSVNVTSVILDLRAVTTLSLTKVMLGETGFRFDGVSLFF